MESSLHTRHRSLPLHTVSECSTLEVPHPFSDHTYSSPVDSYVCTINFAFQMALIYSWIPIDTCNGAHRVIPILYAISVASAELLLVLRCWVLWQRSYPLFAFLFGYWLASFAIQLYACTRFVPIAAPGERQWFDPAGILEPTVETFSYCTSGGQGMWLSAMWLAPMSLDAILLGLVIGRVFWLRRRSNGKVLVGELMLRQQIFYFSIIFCPFLISSVLMTVTNPMLQSIADPPAGA